VVYQPFFFPFQCFPTRGVKRNLFCHISDTRVWYLKGQTWLTLRTATGIIDHDAYDKNEQKSCFLRKQKVFREITRKCQISKLSADGTKPNIRKLFPATGCHFPFFVYEIILCDIL